MAAVSLNSNLAALRAKRALNASTAELSSNLERLSSGKRINHASDDTLWTQLIRSVPEGDDVVYQDLCLGTIHLYVLDKKTQHFSFLLE